jgi:single-strand DNA-binding protein
MVAARSPKTGRAAGGAAPAAARTAANTATNTTRARAKPAGSASAFVGRNEVVLTGRVSAPATVRALPSGDELVSWRLIIAREHANPAAGGGGQSRPRSPTVDTIDCVAYRPVVRRAAAKWTGGEVLEVSGALRRRFWRGPHGTASRCEVEVSEARKLPGLASLVSIRSGTTA